MPAASSRLRAAGPLGLLTWPALEVSAADAAVTARDGGASSGPYATLNLSLTVGEAAAYICVSVSKVRDMISRGEVIINRARRPAPF